MLSLGNVCVVYLPDVKPELWFSNFLTQNYSVYGLISLFTWRKNADLLCFRQCMILGCKQYSNLNDLTLCSLNYALPFFMCSAPTYFVWEIRNMLGKEVHSSLTMVYCVSITVNTFSLHCIFHIRESKYLSYCKISNSYLWWLISCANLTGLRDAQRAGKTLFLGVSVRVFLQRWAFDSVDWVERCPSHVFVSAGISSKPWMAWIEQKEERRANSLSLLELGHPSSLALGHRSSWFLGFWSWTELCHELFWFFTWQMADCGTSWSP